jgi:PTH1 family peptidyl-tRNA hydrolase
MFLFIGLGNKGSKYLNNRHNIGFLFIDYLVEKYHFLKINNKLKSNLYKGNILNNTILLSKPQTMMNLSGESVKLVKSFYKIDIENIFVFHDELDLAIGKIKFKFGGSSAGHNGIKNIDKHIGNEYYRIRIGINSKCNYNEVSKFVLSDFESDEKALIHNKINLIDKNINYVLKKDLNNFMNEINK